MTINKRACRKYADPGLKFDRNNGLLHLDQVRNIVRTAIRNIAGQRMLLLYVYERERLIGGDFRPKWTVFQSKKDYTTLAVREDGKSVWWTSAFDNLGREYCFDKKCAFYGHADEQRITNFCKDDKRTGFDALSRLQSRIKAEQELARRHAKQRIIIERMKVMPPLPKDFRGWIHREILPQYLFYTYYRGAALMKGYCTACRHEVEVGGARHNQKGVCPRCKKEITFKARGRLGYISDRDTVQVLQKISPEEVVIRIAKVYCNYRKKDVPELDIYESTRIFVRRDEQGECVADPYHSSYNSGDLTPWKTGYCPVMYIYQTNFNAETCGQLYCRNLDETLTGTPWQYAQLRQFHQYDHAPLEVLPFLRESLKRPKLEMLIKLGFVAMAADLIYRGSYQPLLDETKKKPHEIFKVEAEDIPFLRDCKVNLNLLRTYQKYVELKLKDREQLLLWQMKNGTADEQLCSFLEFMTPHKLMRYVDEQFALLKGRKVSGARRYEAIQRVLQEYRDYLRMCRDENYDLSNSFVLFPRDLQEGHDRLVKRIKFKADVKRHQQFMELYRSITAHLDFERGGLKIVYPQKPEDIVKEGHFLRHCVGGYVSRVAEKECIILFLRHADAPEKPFFTIEVRNGKVAQVRGKSNCEPTPKVKSFMAAWEKRVLRTVKLPAAA